MANAHSHAHDDHAAHSHHIVGPLILRSILFLLLVFTILTVGQAQFEIWFQNAFDFTFPKWVNIVVVMAIASVKAALVMAFFMQLKYDKPINTMVMAFCYFAVVIFIGFTSMDLLTRDRVTPWKSGPVVAGGTTTPVKSARDRFQTVFFTDAKYVENRLVCRQLDGYAHELTAKSQFVSGASLESHFEAIDALGHAAGHLRDAMIKRAPISGARMHAVEELEGGMKGMSDEAASIIKSLSMRLASEPAPLDSEAAMKADFAAIEAYSHSHGHGAHGGHAHEGSTKNRTRTSHGVSGALDTKPGQHADHSAHGDVHAPASSGH